MQSWNVSPSWVVGAAALCMSATAVMLYLRRQRKAAADSEARCGACGYRVFGLPSSICPECGSDLNVVGLRRPPRWNLLSRSARARILRAVWTVGIVWLAALAWPLFRNHLQPGIKTITDSMSVDSVTGPYALEICRRWEFRASSWLSTFVPPAGESPNCVIVGIDHKGTGGGLSFLEPNQLMLDSPSRPVFVLDLRDLRYACWIPRYSWLDENTRQIEATRTTSRLGQGDDWRDAFESWLDETAQEIEYPGLRAEVNEVFDRMRASPFRSYPQHLSPVYGPAGVSGYSSDWKPDERYLARFVALFVIIWVLGLVLVRQALALQRRTAIESAS
jgi:hypothetical protein